MRLAHGHQTSIDVQAQLPRQFPTRQQAEAEVGALRADRRLGNRQLDERLNAKRWPPLPFRWIEEAVLQTQSEIADAGVILFSPKPNQRLPFEAHLQAIGQTCADGRLRRQSALIRTVYNARSRILKAELYLNGTDRHR